MLVYRIIVLSVLLYGSAASAQIVDSAAHKYKTIVVHPFDGNLARIIEGDQTYYLNRGGEKLRIPQMDAVHLNEPDAIEAYQRELAHAELLPKTVVTYQTEKGHGVLSPDGQVVLAAVYDSIDTKHQRFWKLEKNSQVAMYLPDRTTLPFFEDIGYLDGEHFDVKQGGKWYLYNKTLQKIVSSAYDKFDYCGGCATPSSYVYAQKNGKWGIIDWKGNILVAFKYDHTHHSMRSDNWVSSFSKEGKAVLINIRTQQEFSGGDLTLGTLIASKQGRQGLYGQDGRLAVPFAYEKITVPNPNSYRGYSGKYLVTEKQQKKGVIDLEGNIVIPNEYDDITVYDDYFVGKKKNISYLLDKGHQVLFQLENGEIAHLIDTFYSSGSNGLAVFKFHTNALYGLYFADSRKTVPPQFYSADLVYYAFHGGKAEPYISAERQGVFSLFDLHANRVLPGSYSFLHNVPHLPASLVKIGRGQQVGIYDIARQQEIIPIQYRDVEVIDSLSALILAKSGDYGNEILHLYDFGGNRLIGQDLKTVEPISLDTYLVRFAQDDAFALFYSKQHRLCKLPYPAAYTAGSAKVVVVSDDLKTGKLYDITRSKELPELYDIRQYSYERFNQDTIWQNTPPEHHVLHRFTNKIALIENTQGLGYLNESGKVILAPTFAKADPFYASGVGLVGNYIDPYHYKMHAGYVDTAGTFIFPMQDTENLGMLLPHELVMNEFLFLFKMENNDWKVGIGNANSREIVIPREYSFIRGTFDQRYFLLQQGDKWGVADRAGKIILPAVYDGIKISSALYTGSKPQALFPLLISEGGKWKYITEEGSYLNVEGNDVAD